MNARVARRLAWGLWAVFMVLALVTVVLVAFRGADAFELLWALAASGYVTVGALVASRQPRNVIGWLLIGIAIAFVAWSAANAYVANSDNPGHRVAGLFGGVGLLALYCVGLFLPLFFPDGRLLSRRWRAAVWLDVTALLLVVVGATLNEGRLDVPSEVPLQNPLGVGGVAGDVIDVGAIVGAVLTGIGLVLSVLCLALRLRRLQGRERQQMKWFAYIGVLAFMSLGLAVPAMVVASWPGWVFVLLWIGAGSALILTTVGFPVAIGVSILRYRLYDVDVAIKRTLVYGALTATLGASYVGMVLVLAVLTPLTRDSGLAIATATLAVAALFRPARARIQAVVDRRFYRQRYDAARTLESFSAQLRDELDLEALGADLREVVYETVQPAHVSLWLREVPR